jgi:acylphosphatase
VEAEGIRADIYDVAKIDVYMPERRRIVIHGKVQGVGFRLWLRNVADSLYLYGSCRQLADGSCEAIVQGERRFIKQFVVACKRGPAEASVERIESSMLPVDATLSGFQVER